MKNRSSFVIKWIARIWGTLILSFVLYFTIASFIGNDESGAGFQNTKEILTFICFPLSSVIGLSIALKWERIGGLITILGMICLFVLRIDLTTNLYFIAGILPSGILYILYWYLKEKAIR